MKKFLPIFCQTTTFKRRMRIKMDSFQIQMHIVEQAEKGNSTSKRQGFFSEQMLNFTVSKKP